MPAIALRLSCRLPHCRLSRFPEYSFALSVVGFSVLFSLSAPCFFPPLPNLLPSSFGRRLLVGSSHPVRSPVPRRTSGSLELWLSARFRVPLWSPVFRLAFGVFCHLPLAVCVPCRANWVYWVYSLFILLLCSVPPASVYIMSFLPL